MRSKMMLALVAGLWSGAVFAADCAPDALRVALTTRADADQAARKAVIADLSDKAAHDRAMRVPRRFRAHVEVVAGPQIEGQIVTAELLEQRVRELRGDDA